MWVRLIESTKKAHIVCKASSQSDKCCQKWRGEVRLTPPPIPLMPSCNFFRLRPSRLTVSGPGRRGVESARTDFKFRELAWNLSNTYEILPLLLKFIGEQDSGKIFCQRYNLCRSNPIFDAMFSQILTFLIFFLLINDFFKTKAYS